MSDDQPVLSPEPRFDAPPTDMDERRMHRRARRYWTSLLNGRAFPSVSDLDGQEQDAFGPNSVLIDLGRSTATPVLRFVGRLLCEEAGLKPGPQPLSGIAGGSVLGRLLGHVEEVVLQRGVIEAVGEFGAPSGSEVIWRGVLMPLSSDGETIDFVYGVASWKEMAGAELAAGLAAEVERMLKAGPGGSLAAATKRGA